MTKNEIDKDLARNLKEFKTGQSLFPEKRKREQCSNLQNFLGSLSKEEILPLTRSACLGLDQAMIILAKENKEAFLKISNDPTIKMCLYILQCAFSNELKEYREMNEGLEKQAKLLIKKSNLSL